MHIFVMEICIGVFYRPKGEIMEENAKVRQTLCLKNRECLELDGILHVESFAEDALTLSTKAGRITVEGENLKIEDLSKGEGKILVTGRIDAFYYTDGAEEKRGFFGKIFR